MALLLSFPCELRADLLHISLYKKLLKCKIYMLFAYRHFAPWLSKSFSPSAFAHKEVLHSHFILVWPTQWLPRLSRRHLEHPWRWQVDLLQMLAVFVEMEDKEIFPLKSGHNIFAIYPSRNKSVANPVFIGVGFWQVGTNLFRHPECPAYCNEPSNSDSFLCFPICIPATYL